MPKQHPYTTASTKTSPKPSTLETTTTTDSGSIGFANKLVHGNKSFFATLKKFGSKEQKLMADVPPGDAQRLKDSHGEQRNLNRFSISPSEGGLGRPCSIPTRSASIRDIDISARSGGTDTSSGIDYVNNFESSTFFAIEALEKDLLPQNCLLHRRLGSSLCSLKEKESFSLLPPQDFERMMDSFDKQRNLTRFSSHSEGRVGNLCPMPQRNGSVAALDISLRSESTATSTASAVDIYVDDFQSSTVSAITLGEDFRTHKSPLRRRHGSNLSPPHEQKPFAIFATKKRLQEYDGFLRTQQYDSLLGWHR